MIQLLLVPSLGQPFKGQPTTSVILLGHIYTTEPNRARKQRDLSAAEDKFRPNPLHWLLRVDQCSTVEACTHVPFKARALLA